MQVIKVVLISLIIENSISTSVLRQKQQKNTQNIWW